MQKSGSPEAQAAGVHPDASAERLWRARTRVARCHSGKIESLFPVYNARQCKPQLEDDCAVLHMACVINCSAGFLT